jgi:hypothetical protein
MRWFLDMCIPLYYIGEGDSPDLNKKTITFVKQKSEDKFLVCYQIKNSDLPKWVKRQNVLVEEIIKKISDNSYSLGSSSDSSILTDRDKKKMLKLWATVMNSKDRKKTIALLGIVKLELKRRLDFFFSNFIDEFVVPIDEIDSNLKSSFLNYLNIGQGKKNDSDAKTLTSAIQEHNKNELKILTADKKDWTKDLFEWAVPIGSELSKKYPSFPEINYLQEI